MFEEYLKDLDNPEREALQKVIDAVVELVPSAVEGLSYGLPAFIYKERPLIGFSSNKYGLGIYPYDPRLVRELAKMFDELEVGKGVVRFSAERQVPVAALRFLVEQRAKYIDDNNVK